jgi:hypothetical protein
VPSHESLAQGQAIFHLSADSTRLDYKLIAVNIDNVVFAQIHLAPAGVNGPVVAFMFGPVWGRRFSDVLAQGILTEDDLIGPLAGTFVVGHMRRFTRVEAYVGLHTDAYPPFTLE